MTETAIDIMDEDAQKLMGIPLDSLRDRELSFLAQSFRRVAERLQRRANGRGLWAVSRTGAMPNEEETDGGQPA